ncbi:substrate-binding domain-containing protein [Polyangium jinanense]|uniref:Substrate-binding domain-containing protein n=1 Tax=Polyangium jinanense TaxID=2829994 RepID=A0A9X3XJ46_9BACT|nr:substrate-binding domain-containing protein [Polyangium jinanense]MDC3962344.1 substrate-binding domain-containing protein [Polyangium jinanense]MDC3989141.1 substrate-binding domain-containing protein [Polyangium jinanense]
MHALSRRSFGSLWGLFLLALFCLSCGKQPAGGRALRLATTTSLKDAGLLDELLPAFEAKTGYRVEVNALGSGKSLRALRDGTVDVAITHAPAEEQAAVAAGEVGRRSPFMHNEFVIVGPADQVGVVAGAGDVEEALRRIASSGRTFVSRGDDSGTNQREMALWKAAGIGANSAFIVRANAGMGETLERASDDGAFALSDRATFVTKQKDLKLSIVFQGDAALRNTYSVIEPKAGGGANAEGARAFAEYLLSAEGRALIGAFGVKASGEPLFTPEAR